jgi:hypothetical protein
VNRERLIVPGALVPRSRLSAWRVALVTGHRSLVTLFTVVSFSACRATTHRPYFTPLPVATVAQVELGIPEATRALSEALARDSITLRTIRERDGFLDSGWLDARTLEPTRARPLGPEVVRVRAWVNPDKEFWSELVVEATYRPLDDPSRPERELDVALPESHPLQRRIAGALRALVERYGDAEALRALAPPAPIAGRPDTAKKDTTVKPALPKPDTPSVHLPSARRADLRSGPHASFVQRYFPDGS